MRKWVETNRDIRFLGLPRGSSQKKVGAYSLSNIGDGRDSDAGVNKTALDHGLLAVSGAKLKSLSFTLSARSISGET